MRVTTGLRTILPEAGSSLVRSFSLLLKLKLTITQLPSPLSPVLQLGAVVRFVMKVLLAEVLLPKLDLPVSGFPIF
jgi:hypothetical protein